jgi:hypothetical protein
MANTLDIWRSANIVVKQCGDDAWFHASTRADELRDQGDLDGAATWRRILNAIVELQRVEPEAGEASHC